MLRWLLNRIFWGSVILLIVVSVAATGGIIDYPALDVSSDDDPKNIDTYGIEKEIHEQINNERENRNLSEISYDNDLAAIAQDHSEDMASENFVSHEGSDGSDFEQRYREAGYNCSVNTGQGRVQGAENVAQTFYQEELDGGQSIETPDELAEAIVTQWMQSPGHRENILKPYWQNQGIGLTITDDKKVFVTQNFC